MPSHYNPNQPRNAEGMWVDAGGAIRSAASDKKKKKSDSGSWVEMYDRKGNKTWVFVPIDL